LLEKSLLKNLLRGSAEKNAIRKNAARIWNVRAAQVAAGQAQEAVIGGGDARKGVEDSTG
jgi:hypothetical protein